MIPHDHLIFVNNVEVALLLPPCTLSLQTAGIPGTLTTLCPVVLEILQPSSQAYETESSLK